MPKRKLEEDGDDCADGCYTGVDETLAHISNDDVTSSSDVVVVVAAEALADDDDASYDVTTTQGDGDGVAASDTPVNVTPKSSALKKQSEDAKSNKKRKSVVFNGVRVYYFPRSQGFTCVPSQGGSTLGMDEQHSHSEDFTIREYAKQQRQLHKLIIEEHKRLGKLPRTMKRTRSSNSVGSEINSAANKTSSAGDDSESDESELEVDDYYFLQPLSTRQRRILLRACGVRKIDTVEKDECRDIRVSREMCGCTCKMYCDPRTCACTLAGIKCQVDRLSFPCGCSQQVNCHNPNGRIEFNPLRVRTHFLHTLMRLELEQKSATPSTSSAEATCSVTPTDAQCGADEYNSNDRGSCCDCQLSEFTNDAARREMHAIMEALPDKFLAPQDFAERQEYPHPNSDSCSDQSSSDCSGGEMADGHTDSSCMYKLDMSAPNISEMLAPINYQEQQQNNCPYTSSGIEQGTGHGNTYLNNDGGDQTMLDMSGCWSSENYSYNQQLASIIENGACYNGPGLLQDQHVAAAAAPENAGPEIGSALQSIPIFDTLPELSENSGPPDTNHSSRETTIFHELQTTPLSTIAQEAEFANHILPDLSSIQYQSSHSPARGATSSVTHFNADTSTTTCTSGLRALASARDNEANAATVAAACEDDDADTETTRVESSGRLETESPFENDRDEERSNLVSPQCSAAGIIKDAIIETVSA